METEVPRKSMETEVSRKSMDTEVPRKSLSTEVPRKRMETEVARKSMGGAEVCFLCRRQPGDLISLLQQEFLVLVHQSILWLPAMGW